MLHKHLHLIDSLILSKTTEKALPAVIKKHTTVYKQLTIPLITAWFLSSKLLKKVFRDDFSCVVILQK